MSNVRLVAYSALLLSIANTGLLVWRMSIDPTERIKHATYDAILQETYEELVPAFKEFDITMEKPKTFRELLAPLVRVKPVIEPVADQQQ